MRWSQQQFDEYERKHHKPVEVSAASSNQTKDELKLHVEIMKWCDSQWPRVKYIRARSDRESTIAVGAQDFTIFLPCGRTLCVECKAKNGKLKPEQMQWQVEMKRLGHTVYVCRGLEEFLALVTSVEAPGQSGRP